MKKTIKELMGLDIKKNEMKKEIPKHKSFFLDDLLDHDPTKICPECESSQIITLHTHNLDGHDYECKNCKFTYEVVLYNRGDDIYH